VDGRCRQNEWPQSPQKRVCRSTIVPQLGQLLCVLAMSKPHSAQKRPPDIAVRQLGQAMADDAVLARAPLWPLPCRASAAC
jgi:hypothetical protein